MVPHCKYQILLVGTVATEVLSTSHVQNLLLTYTDLFRSYFNAGCSNECDDFQIAVLVNWDEYEKQRNSGVLVVKCHLNS